MCCFISVSTNTYIIIGFRKFGYVFGSVLGYSKAGNETYCADIGLECLASWKDGSEMYFYGRLSGSDIVDKEDKYRCFVRWLHYCRLSLHRVWFTYLLRRPRERLWSIVMSTSVSVSVSRISSEQRVRSLPNFCSCCLWPWLGPPSASLQYIMYFRFVDDIMFFL